MIVTAIIAALCGAWRIGQFGYIELVGDQAFFTQWILRLANVDHVFPVNADGQGLIKALMHDEESFLNVLIRQIYQAQTLLFIVISVLFFTLASLVAGVSMEVVVAASIVASVIALWLLALFPVIGRGAAAKDDRMIEPYAVGGLVLIIGCASSFFNIFSAMGPHNTGVMFLLLAALVTQRWLIRVSETGLLFADKQATILMFAVQFLAIYAHYTNIFIIAPATVMAIILDPSLRPWRRLGVIARFSGVSFIAFIPALAQIVLYNIMTGDATNDQTFAGIATDFVLVSDDTAGNAISERVALWFRNVAIIYSGPGLFLGIIGVVGMAWRDRIVLPAAIVIVHFLFGSLMPSFGQYDRTAAYLLPMLMLGDAWLVVAATGYVIKQRHSGLPRTAVAILLAVLILTAMTRHAVTEYSRINDPSGVLRWGQLTGKAVWRPIVAQIEASIPGDGILVPWNYGLSHQFMSMSERSGGDLRVLRPLETLYAHWEARTLRHYIRSRGLVFPPDQPTFILAPGDVPPEILSRNLQSVLGHHGFALPGIPLLTPRYSWKLPREKYLKVDLRFFKVSWQ